MTNYLLKPIDTDELIRSITEIRETLDKNNHLKQERLAWQEARLIAEHAEKSTFFQNIFSGHASVSESAQLREFGVLQDVPCTVIVSDGRPKVITASPARSAPPFRQHWATSPAAFCPANPAASR